MENKFSIRGMRFNAQNLTNEFYKKYTGLCFIKLQTLKHCPRMIQNWIIKELMNSAESHRHFLLHFDELRNSRYSRVLEFQILQRVFARE